MSTIYYNPLDERCKSITGGVATSEEVTFNLFHMVTPSKGAPTLENCAKSEKQASFVLNKDGEEIDITDSVKNMLLKEDNNTKSRNFGIFKRRN